MRLGRRVSREMGEGMGVGHRCEAAGRVADHTVAESLGLQDRERDGTEGAGMTSIVHRQDLPRGDSGARLESSGRRGRRKGGARGGWRVPQG